MFKLKPIPVACGMALAAISGSSFAVAPGQCANGVATVDVFLSGASAPQALLAGIANNILAPGYDVVFSPVSGSTAAGTDYRAYCGPTNVLLTSTVPGNANIPAGTVVRLVNRARGGSVYGVTPVGKNQALETLDLSSSACIAATAAGRNYDCIENPVPSRVPDFGVSDIEPQMFKSPYNTCAGCVPSITQLGTTGLGRLTIRQGTQVIFGIGVTTNIPNTVKFNNTNVASILSGAYADWSQVDGSLSGNIVACRRDQGSGTQASSNEYFEGWPCSQGNFANSAIVGAKFMSDSAGYRESGTGTNADPFIINPNPVGGGPTYVENPTSGAVRNCLFYAQAGQDYLFQFLDDKWYKVTFSNGGPYKALGWLSIESQNTTNTDALFGVAVSPAATFRLLNGEPAAGWPTGASSNANTQLAAQKGEYTAVFENTYQYNTLRLTGADPGFAGEGINPAAQLPGQVITFMDNFIRQAESNTVLQTLSPDNRKQSVLAIPGIASNPTPNPGVNIVSKWSRNGNSCRPGIFKF